MVQRKVLMTITSLLFLCLVDISSLCAQSPPIITRYVNDFAAVIDHEDELLIEETAKNLEQDFGVTLSVVSVESYSPYESIEDFSFDLSVSSTFGFFSDGSAVLIVITMSERRIRIELGSKVAKKISDEICGIIIDDEIVPWLKEGKYGIGLYAGAKAISSVLYSANDSESSKLLIGSTKDPLHVKLRKHLEPNENIYSQRILGHASIATTQRYTRVEIADLKKVLKRCHPRERHQIEAHDD